MATVAGKPFLYIRLMNFHIHNKMDISVILMLVLNMVRKDILNKYNANENFSFEIFLQENVNNPTVGAFVIENGYFIDIGISSDYEKTQVDFKELF